MEQNPDAVCAMPYAGWAEMRKWNPTNWGDGLRRSLTLFIQAPQRLVVAQSVREAERLEVTQRKGYGIAVDESNTLVLRQLLREMLSSNGGPSFDLHVRDAIQDQDLEFQYTLNSANLKNSVREDVQVIMSAMPKAWLKLMPESLGESEIGNEAFRQLILSWFVRPLIQLDFTLPQIFAVGCNSALFNRIALEVRHAVVIAKCGGSIGKDTVNSILDYHHVVTVMFARDFISKDKKANAAHQWLKVFQSSLTENPKRTEHEMTFIFND